MAGDLHSDLKVEKARQPTHPCLGGTASQLLLKYICSVTPLVSGSSENLVSAIMPRCQPMKLW